MCAPPAAALPSLLRNSRCEGCGGSLGLQPTENCCQDGGRQGLEGCGRPLLACAAHHVAGQGNADGGAQGCPRGHTGAESNALRPRLRARNSREPGAHLRWPSASQASQAHVPCTTTQYGVHSEAYGVRSTTLRPSSCMHYTQRWEIGPRHNSPRFFDRIRPYASVMVSLQTDAGAVLHRSPGAPDVGASRLAHVRQMISPPCLGHGCCFSKVCLQRRAVPSVYSRHISLQEE